MDKQQIADFAAAHRAGFCKVPKDLASFESFSWTPFASKYQYPASIDARGFCTVTEDQGSKPWCAAYAAANWAEAVRWRRYGYVENIDPTWVYQYAKRIDGDPNGDGTTLTAVLDALLHDGIFDRATCKIRRIGACADEIKQALHRFGAVLGGFNITSEWYELNGAKTFVCRPGGDLLGGHAVVVCGYDANGVYIQNSWGAQWGDRGFGGISWDCFREQFLYGAVLSNIYNGFTI